VTLRIDPLGKLRQSPGCLRRQAIEREVRQNGKSQKATHQLKRRIDGRCRRRSPPPTYCAGAAACISPPPFPPRTTTAALLGLKARGLLGALVGQLMAAKRAPGRHFIDTEAASSFLWFATIQGIEGKQDLANLAPKGCFIAAQAIEREVGQIGKTQKAARELNGRIDNRADSIRL
jgi:hypothetical protein